MELGHGEPSRRLCNQKNAWRSWNCVSFSAVLGPHLGRRICLSVPSTQWGKTLVSYVDNRVTYSPVFIAFGIFALSFSKFVGMISGLGNLLFYGAVLMVVASLYPIARKHYFSQMNLMLLIVLALLAIAAIPQGWIYPTIHTSMPSFAATIGPYANFSQIVIGLFYDLRAAIYIFLFYEVCTLPRVEVARSHGLFVPLRALYFAATVQFLALAYGFVNPRFHQWLLHFTDYTTQLTSGYDHTIFFAFRGVALLTNTYEAGFFFALVCVLSVWAFKAGLLRVTSIGIAVISGTGLILTNTRTAVMFFGISIIVMFVSPVRHLRRITRLLGVLAILMSVGVVAYYASDAFRLSVNATISMSDAVGASQAHRTFMLGGIRLASEFPFGIGAGRANFSRIPYGLAYAPESYLLSIVLDNGILFGAVFIALYLRFWRRTRQVAGSIARPLVDGVLLGAIVISVINMQFLESGFVFPLALLTIICGRVAAESRSKHEYRWSLDSTHLPHGLDVT